MNDPINNFFKAINELYESIINIEGKEYINNHKQTLLFNFLDFLSKVPAKDEISNRERFTSFIHNFCDWSEDYNVSLPYLKIIVEKDTSDELSKVREFCFTNLNMWKKSTPITLDYDPPIKDIDDLWPEGYKALGKIAPKHLCHLNLFWSLRNSLVHEMRPLGKAFDLFTIDIPHYNGRIDIDYNNTNDLMLQKQYVWELNYPTKFYITIIQNAIKNLRKYCYNERLNPYLRFRIESSWIYIEKT